MARDDFLPSEYVEHRQDGRTYRIGFVLFGVVVLAVTIAFLVQRSDWMHVLQARDQIAQRYAEAGDQVEAVAELEARLATIHDRDRILLIFSDLAS